MSKQDYPAGWDADRVQRLIDHYENISDDEMIAEDEAAHKADKNQLPVPTGAPKTNGRQRENNGKKSKTASRGKRKAKRA